MLFHTWPFLLFFAVVYSVYLPLRRTRFWLLWLLVTSYFFYGWWNPLYLGLIFYSTVLDYWVVLAMSRSRRRGVWLAVSIVNNLGLLGFFKYGRFVTDNLNALLAAMGVTYSFPGPEILLPEGIPFFLPVGISFYTFQSMSYTIDYYRGHLERERSFIRFATFVSLFPQLVAGPIERAKALLPQLQRRPVIHAADVTDGVSLFIVGLFKKVALADYLALYVDPVYAVPEEYGAPALLLATFAFAWQIYFDFSGYTDMARGIARMMGFRLMLNFNNPYLAADLADFWSRWHISLSSWFRDYVYIPLGGNRSGGLLTYRNIVVTMVVSGLWHGAAWTFVIWGALHALGVIVTREASRSRFYRERVPRPIKCALVFLFVCFTWIFFRAASVSDAWLIVTRIFTAGWADPRFPLLALALVGAAWLYEIAYETRARRLLQLSAVRVAIVVFMVLYLCIVPGTGEQAFIYFQF